MIQSCLLCVLKDTCSSKTVYTGDSAGCLRHTSPSNRQGKNFGLQCGNHTRLSRIRMSVSSALYG